MIITIFGASGKIGRLLTEQALGKGYIIKAYVHNLQEIGFSHPNLEIVEGTIHDYYKIKQAITESNAVISTMEPSKSFKKKGYPIFEAHRHIIMAMERLHIKRFITITSLSSNRAWLDSHRALLCPPPPLALLSPVPTRDTSSS